MSPPRRVGRFELGERLGGGAMGAVHRAVDLETGRSVALKTSIAHTHAQVESLRAEIAALARLSHPGIVPIVAHGVDVGLPYVAMELLEGRNLAEALIETEPLRAPVGPSGTIVLGPEARVAGPHGPASAPRPSLFIQWDPVRFERVGRVVVRLARALAYLHGEGIVHRDLKPENVVIVGDDRPVLVDFGLARARFGQTRERVSAERGPTGTPYYMSPEQITNQLLDARADLYALGALIHHLVAGQPPFVADDLLALFDLHLNATPRPLSEVVQGIPPVIDELVLALLEKDRSKRLAYAEDVVDALAEIGVAPPRDAGEAAPRPYVYGAACVGRDKDLAALDVRLDRAAQGEAGVVFVTGESGVGKTRFLAECLARLPSTTVLSAGALEQGAGVAAETIAALRPLLLWLADHARAGHVDEVRGWLGDAGALVALYEPALLLVADPLASRPVPGPDRLVEALAQALVSIVLEIARARAVVIVIDDAQWADAATSRFVERFVERVASGVRDADAGWLHPSAALGACSALLIVASRAEEEADWARALRHAAASRPTAAVSAIELLPLDDAAMSAMGAAMLGEGGRESAPPSQAAWGARGLARILQASQGNPFTLAETIRGAVEDGALARQGRGRWALSRSPEIVAELEGAALGRSAWIAGARIDRLEAGARRFAEVVSAIARPAAIDLVTEVSGASDPGVLAELMRRGIVVEPSPGLVAMAHDKLRERCYGALDAAARVAIHLSVARALASRAAAADGPPRADDLATLAAHYDRGGAPLAAAAAALAAADAYEARSATRDVLRCAESAWRFVGSLDDDASVDVRAAAAARLGGLLASLGKLDAAVPLLDAAVALADHVAGGAAGSRVRAAAHVGLAYVAYLRGQREPLFHHAGLAHAAATRSGDARILGRAENTLGIANGSSGRFRQAIAHYTRAAEIASGAGDTSAVGRHFSNISINHRHLGDLDAARRAAERAVELTAPSANAHANAWANLGRILLEAEDLDRADDALARSISIAERVGAEFIVAESAWARAMVHVGRGELHTAAQHAARALELSRRAGLTVNEGMARRAEGVIALVAGRADEARAALEESVRILEPTQERSELADSLADLALALERAGDPIAATAHRDRARGIYAQLDMKGRLAALDDPAVLL